METTNNTQPETLDQAIARIDREHAVGRMKWAVAVEAARHAIEAEHKANGLQAPKGWNTIEV